MKKSLIAALSLALAMPVLPAFAQQAVNPYLANVPLSAGPITLPVSPGGRGMRPYEMSNRCRRKKRNKLMKQIMPMMGMVKSMDVKDVMNMMASSIRPKRV
jgi:hypothetical protein